MPRHWHRPNAKNKSKDDFRYQLDTATADVAEIRRTLDLLLEPGQVAELRVINTQQGTVSGYFTDFDKLAGKGGLHEPVPTPS